MEALANPFTPTFGQTPFHLAGYNDFSDSFSRALTAKHRTPQLSTVVIGIPGSGKTCLLSHLSHLASKSGWAAANVSAVHGLLDDVLVQATESCSSGSLAAPAPRSHSPRKASNWRSYMTQLLRSLRSNYSGLLITVDDANTHQEELTQLVSCYQHFVREHLRVSLVIAGTFHGITALLKQDETSFLQRAETITTGLISFCSAEDCFRKTIQAHGRSIGANALRAAVDAAGGYPYLIQLIGYRIWDQNPQEQRISLADANAGIGEAWSEYTEHVLEPIYNKLSDGDLRFLQLMLDNDNPTKMTDIAHRLGVSTSYAGQYKNRLLRKSLIKESRRGCVEIILPGLRDYLQTLQ